MFDNPSDLHREDGRASHVYSRIEGDLAVRISKSTDPAEIERLTKQKEHCAQLAERKRARESIS